MDNQQLAVVTRRSIEGVPGCKIAQELGVHESTVSRAKADPAIRAKIEAGANRIINRGLTPAIRTITRLAAMGAGKEADKDKLKLALDASKHITAIAGLSGGTPGTIINTLIQINQDPEHQAELTNVERFLQMEAWKGESIDVTPSHTATDVQPVNIPGNSDPVEAGREVRDADMGVSLGVSGNMLDDGP